MDMIEDVPAKDVPVKDMMSTQGLYDLLRMSPSRTDIVSLSGHQVLNREVRNRDIL